MYDYIYDGNVHNLNYTYAYILEMFAEEISGDEIEEYKLKITKKYSEYCKNNGSPPEEGILIVVRQPSSDRFLSINGTIGAKFKRLDKECT